MNKLNNTSADGGVSVSGQIGNYTYVDLGLKSGIKWATCNVGASSPTDYGDYFAWGETQPKKDYNLNTYKWFHVNHKEKKEECKIIKYGKNDKIYILDAEDDAATVNLGKEWCMPTIADIKELYSSCNWQFTNNFRDSGVAGVIGISKINNNIIFFPAAGYRCLSHISKEGIYSYIWSSSLDRKYPDGAYSLGIEEYDADFKSDYRDYGQSVRAVVKSV